MKSQNHGDSFGYKQHMQNSLLLNNTIGNGCFATLQQQHQATLALVPPAAAMALGALQDYSARDSRGKTIDFTICFAVHTRNHLPTLYNMCVNIANNTSKIF